MLVEIIGFESVFHSEVNALQKEPSIVILIFPRRGTELKQVAQVSHWPQ